MKRRTLVLAAATGGVALPSLTRAQAGWPNRPVRLVIPFPPGGTNDAMGRIAARQVEAQIGQAVVVENKPGANGILGYEQVAKAPPDGYTLLHTSPSIVVNEFIYKQQRVGMDDFVPVSSLCMGTGYLVLVSADGPIKSMADLVAAAKLKKDAVAYGSAGVGNTTHLAAALLGAKLGIDMLHVPFKGLADSMNAVVAGSVQLALTPPTLAVTFVRGNRLRAIAFTGARRWNELPDVPTLAEAGLPGFEINGGWFGWFGPKGLPLELAARLHGELAKAVQVPAVRDFILKGGYGIDVRPPAEFGKFLAGEMTRYGEAVKAAKIEPQ
jgi:tripartite-type tricarboxylate transporter receptor subunit TctC